MNTIVFIRHGETDMAGRFCGHSDPKLNLAGESQVIRLANQVATLEIEHIYSSDLRRASQTATVIAQRISIGVDYLPALREIFFGHWEGLNWQEIQDKFPQEANRWIEEYPLRAAPGGEAYADFTARIEVVLAAFLNDATDRTIAIVTHRGVMRYALTRFFGFTEEETWAKTLSYCATVVIARRPSDREVLV